MDSIEKIYRSIEDMEQRLLLSTQSHLKDNTKHSVSFQAVLEWFFTWRIKLEDLENTHWCDGVRNLFINKVGEQSLSLEGIAYIGPEKDVQVIHKSPFSGTVTLDEQGNVIRSYDFTINMNERTFQINKL